MSTRVPAFLALACVGFVATAPAHADTDGTGPDSDDQDRIVVNGQRNNELVGPKAVAPVVNTPRSVVVLSNELIEQTGSTTLADALRTVPGITFGAAEGGNPIGDRPFIRGFDSQGSTFLDGVRDIGAQTREVFATEQVQIVRGSDSTLGGRGSAGGSINIISKLPVAGNFIAGSASVGTAEFRRFTLDVNQKVTDRIGVRIAGMFHDQDVAGRDAIWNRRWGIAPSITLGMGTDTRLTAAYYYYETHELPDTGIPYSYVLANAPGTGTIYSQPAMGEFTTIGGTRGTIARSAFYGLKNRDFRDTQVQQATLRAEHDFGGITLRNLSRYGYTNQSYIFTQPDDSQGNVYGTSATAPTGAAATRGDQIQGGYVWRRANTRYGYTETLTNQTDLYGTFKTGSIEHSFSTGVEISWEKARRGTFAVADGRPSTGPRCNAGTLARYSCTSLFNPTPNDPWVNYASDTSTTPAAIARNAPITETQNDASTVAVYGFDSITLLPQLILNVGARYDRFKSTVTPGQTATATSTFQLSKTSNLFNWQAGLVFKPTRNTSLYASYATAATPPNSLVGEGQEGNSLGTAISAAALLDSLKVETTKSYEVGAKASLFHEQLALGAALFQTDTNNARVTGPDNTVEFIGKRRIRGLELTFNGNVTNWLSVFGGYTHLDAVIVDGGFTALTAPVVGSQPARVVLVPAVTTGRQAPQTPKDSFTLSANLKPTKRLSLGGGAYYTSRVFGGYQDNRTATQDAAGAVTVNPATRVLARTVPSYWRFDAQMGYQLTDRIKISANIQNLTDKTYYTAAFTSHYATIAPGRSAFATLNVKF
ncbi:TonB-dependent receptor [Sphingomonas elodea]|uniref:TonB-dependent receptor n=1 Tax=Sphingomonas elodea TaxID=179878 RepID=UPI0002630401|nr:TonB-dependent receptor [Sphingomonas elodea]